MEDQKSEYYTLREVAVLFNFSIDQIRLAVKKNDFPKPVIMFGREWRFVKEEIQAFRRKKEADRNSGDNS